MNSDTQKVSSHSYRELFRFAVIALIVVLPIRLYVAKPFIVSGTSMYPTFMNGEYLVVDQLSHRFENPERGEVIIFKYPPDPSKFLIKRVIGVPGDTIMAKNGVITIINSEYPDGFILDQSYVKGFFADTFTDTLADGEYFVMGDNRNSSLDSRRWGHLKDSYIIGSPILRLLPLQRIDIRPGIVDKNLSQTSSVEIN